MSLIHRKPPSFVLVMDLSADDGRPRVGSPWVEPAKTLQELTHYFRGSFAPEDRPEVLAERFVGKVARDPGDQRVVVVDHIRLTVWERFFLPARYEAEVKARIVATPGDAS